LNSAERVEHVPLRLHLDLSWYVMRAQGWIAQIRRAFTSV